MIAIGIHGAPEVGQLQTEDDIGFRDDGTSAARLIQRVAGREIHASALIDDGGLQRFGKLHKVLHAGSRSSRAIRDDHRILGGGQQLCGFADRAGISLGWRRSRQALDSEFVFVGNGPLLKFAVCDDEYGLHRRSHRDFVGAR